MKINKTRKWKMKTRMVVRQGRRKARLPLALAHIHLHTHTCTHMHT